jgi:hypothetical protein
MILVLIIVMALVATAATIAAEVAIKGDAAIGKLALEKLSTETARPARWSIGAVLGFVGLSAAIAVVSAIYRVIRFLLQLIF